MVLGIINDSTTVIQIREIGDGIVYVSSSTAPGHFATILDDTGCIRNTTVYISTTAGVTFTGGATVTTISQPFGYVSLVSESPSVWSIVNRSPFSDPTGTIRGIDTRSISSGKIVCGSKAQTAEANAAAIVTGSFRTDVGIADQVGIGLEKATFPGRMYMSGTGVCESITSQSLFCGPITAADISASSVTATEYLLMNGNIRASTFSVSNLIGSNATVDNSLYNISSTTASTLVAGPMSTVKMSTATMKTGYLQIGSGYIAGFATAIMTPVDTNLASTNTISSSQIQTSSIQISELVGTNVSNVQLGASAIQNASGSLLTSSISVAASRGSFLASEIISSRELYLSSFAAEQYSIVSNSNNGSLKVGNLATDVLTAVDIRTTVLFGQELVANTLSPVDFNVDTSMRLLGAAFLVPNAIIDANSGDTTTDYAESAETVAMNIHATSLITDEQLIMPSISTSAIVTKKVSNRDTRVSTINASKNIVVGSPLIPGPMSPSLTFSTIFPGNDNFNPIDDPPYQTGGGRGTYSEPFRAFCTKNTYIVFSINNPSGGPLYFNIAYNHTNITPPSPFGRDGFVRGYLNNDLSNPALNIVYNILNINQSPYEANLINDINIANYPPIGNNPITGDSTPWFIWQVGSGSVTTDSISIWVSNNTNLVDIRAPSIVDTNAGIEMNVASIRWPSTVYQTTIENSLNDIQTRSIFCVNATNRVSDRSLKREIVPASLDLCAEAILRVPLRRYEYIPEYISTFSIKDKTRLGILTTELATVFPKSVRLQETPLSTFQVASVEQLKYAHLGATKFLAEEVERLREEIAALK